MGQIHALIYLSKNYFFIILLMLDQLCSIPKPNEIKSSKSAYQNV